MPRDVSLSDSKCWNDGQKWVKVDGSGRVTLRSRQFLRKCIPFTKQSSDDIISQHVLPATASTRSPQQNPESLENVPELPSVVFSQSFKILIFFNMKIE